LIDLGSEFADRNIIFKALDLGIDSSTAAGKLVLRIFSALADYERETILEKTRAGQLLAKANGKHIGRFKGPNAENSARVKTALENGLSVSEIVKVSGTSLSSVKRYRKAIHAGKADAGLCLPVVVPNIGDSVVGPDF
jgi:DNA invertase Pin-like site-specific DNA recombinase